MPEGYEFGPFHLDPAEHRLLRDSLPVPLPPKAFDLLVDLVEHAGRLREKAQLMEALWPDTFVEEVNLAYTVSAVRRALGDDRSHPQFIETVATKGYRFVAAVRAVGEDPEGDASSSLPTARHPAALLDLNGRSPYPGLRSFTERDAAVFFGREDEASALWTRIRDHPLLAVIGPSGAGKTSFLRAGVIPRCPDGWAAVACTPGMAPLRALGQALAPALASDVEALRQLVSFDDPEVAFALLGRWRQAHGQALVVIDQFEELFTNNPPESQARVATLVGRLVTEADIHVVLSLRDDFLMRCHDHEALAGVFSEVTPLGALTLASLRRALVEPARRLGYRFEDDALADEMIDRVTGARAALPLLAFAVARLWELRDPEQRVLTRAAYQQVGGVAGALAQHAEATLDRIGAAHHDLVRDLFRHLVTAQGTRAVMDRDELLSAFPKRPEADAVLRALVDARLLTSYEVDGDTGEHARHRIEIVHESLLTAWPRLVRWQTQDEQAAQLRDQLKQAAHLWEGKGRSADLLWTGTMFREFQLWRDRYSGALTSHEEAFAAAMSARARRTQRRRQLAVGAIVLAALVVAGVTSALWRRSVAAAARAEASRLVTLGRLELDRDPGRALAYTLASLEVTDTPVARRFAVEAMWHGPPARVLGPEPDVRDSFWLDFSEDGGSLAQGGQGSTVAVWPRAGGPPIRLGGHEDAEHTVEFAAGGRVLVTSSPHRLRIWQAPEWRETHAIARKSLFDARVAGARVLTFVPATEAYESFLVDAWSLDGGHLEGPVTWPGWNSLVLNRAGTMLAYASDTNVMARSLEGIRPGPERTVGTQPTPVKRLSVSASGNRLASSDAEGTVRVWSASENASLVREVRAEVPNGIGHAHALDSAGALLMTPAKGVTANVWHVDAPAGVLPLALRAQRELTYEVEFSRDGLWAAALGRVLTLWPLSRMYPLVLQSASAALPGSLAFDPLGKWLAVASAEGVRLWPVPGVAGKSIQLLHESDEMATVKFTKTGDRLLVGVGGTVRVVPVDGRSPRELPMPRDAVFNGFVNLAVSPDGRLAAAGAGASEPGHQTIAVWDLATEQLLATLRPPRDGPPDSTIYQDNVVGIAFAPDGRLVTSGQAGVRVWDVQKRTSTSLHRPKGDWPGPVTVLDDGTIVWAKMFKLLGDEGSVWRYNIADCRWSELAWTANTGSMATDRRGTTLVTSMRDGTLRVGSLSEGEPHLFYGHAGAVLALVVSPDGRWMASGDTNGTIRVWRLPDRTRVPFQALPYEQILARLRSFTNLRAVRDATSPTGYAIKAGENIGWREVPEW